MAATSHDFWQKNLGSSVWKALHMAVYPAYGLLVLHVACGALLSEGSPIYLVLALGGATAVIGLHLATGLRERRRDAGSAKPPADGWIAAGCVDEIRNQRAKIVCLRGRERVAVFRHGNRLSAVTNVCAHQRGPLGEGKIVDGCIACPWHGWEYRPEDGRSPPPFEERIATYRLRVVGREIWLDPRPLPPGTPVEPAIFEESGHDAQTGRQALG
jgi:nitrite reductase/ring-hydroxylating ferredoxin subunit